MADLRNCSKCGRLFGYTGNPLCSFCLEEEEDEYVIVRDYLYDNPGSSAAEVSEATGVDTEKIMRFLREERLQISSENQNMLLECESCGKPIVTGRFCHKCKDNLKNALRKEFGLDKPAAPPEDDYKLRPDKEKMYTATRKR
jgi:flagellar operon protein (TIGR03826 family)